MSVDLIWESSSSVVPDSKKVGQTEILPVAPDLSLKWMFVYKPCLY